MSKRGPIIIVEDDHDDWEVFKMAFGDLEVKNELRFFDRCDKAVEYLLVTSEQPFLIICDINMPMVSGLEFRKTINENEYLRKKSIPFIFMSTSAAQGVVEQAYDLTVQGFFEKGQSMDVIKKMLLLIVDYWQTCRHPNTHK